MKSFVIYENFLKIELLLRIPEIIERRMILHFDLWI
jgi:hypothetical protein